MKITFVAIGWEQLPISLLSAIAKNNGHTVSLAFSVSLFNDRSHLNIPSLANIFDDRKQVIDKIRKEVPDVLAFSVLTPNYQWMLSIAREAKAMFPQVKIIFGGVHPSAVPEQVLKNPEVDIVCIGEADISFPLILEAIENNRLNGEIIPNTRYKKSDGSVIRGPQDAFIQDLNTLPIFDKTIWEEYIPLGDSYITMASRGCPYRCTFCFNNFFANLPDQKKGKYVRQRSVEHMMYELRLAKKRYRLRMIEFFDDVFTVDKVWLKKFLYEYKKDIGVPFQVFTHVKYIDDDVGRMMSEAGCFSAQIGVQSLDADYKRTQVKRYEKNEDIAKTVEIFRKYKVKAKFDHMLGLPGEPIEAQEAARNFYVEHPPYSIQTYWTSYFPGTEMVEQGLKLNLLTKEDVESVNEGLGCDIYSNGNKNIDPAKMRTYQAYQIIFKLLPNVPYAIRKRLRPEMFSTLPAGLCSLFSFMLDVLIGLIKLSPDHILYARYYLYHMARSIFNRMGIQIRPATRIHNTQKIVFMPDMSNNPQIQMKKEEYAA